MRMMRLSGSPAIFFHRPKGLVVFGEDGDGELVLGQAEFLGDQRPGPFDRIGLEIVAEGEIAEHLEERVVAGRIADIVEIVVLAAGAHAFLRRGGAAVGPLLGAGEHVLELHHAGIGEHQGGVVARHQRRGSDDFVAVALEEVEKGRADLGESGHCQCVRLSGIKRWGVKYQNCAREGQSNIRHLPLDP